MLVMVDDSSTVVFGFRKSARSAKLVLKQTSLSACPSRAWTIGAYASQVVKPLLRTKKVLYHATI